DQALLLGDEGGQRVEHRCLARAGAAGDDGGDARLDGGGEQFCHRRPQRADLDQLVEVERFLGKLADRHQWAVDADRTHGNVDARAVLQAGVAQRMRFVDAAADGGNDLVDDAQQVLLVLETNGQRLQHAAALHVDAFMTVDQDIADRRVLEQRLKRAETRHFVEYLGNEFVELLRIKREPLDQHVLRDQLLNVIADLLFGQLFKRRKVDLLDQAPVQAYLGVEQFFAMQRIGNRRLRLDGQKRRLRRRFGKDRPGHALERGYRRLLDGWLRCRNAPGCKASGHGLILRRSLPGQA